MQPKERLFLTVEDALEALLNDFEQYPIQWTLFSTLMPLAFGNDAYLIRRPNEPKVWVKTPDLKKPHPLNPQELGQWIVKRLRQKPMPLEDLAKICTRVFQTAARPAFDSENTVHAGIWVDTGMDDFTCIRCGRCCRTLNYRDGCSVADYLRWQALGRDDILECVGVVRSAGRVTGCRIWMDPGTNHYTAVCPWLRRIGGEDRYTCMIHDVRPSICRQYPGSRKHARMTGCPAV